MSVTQKSENNGDGVPKLKNMDEFLDRRRKDILSVLHAVDSSPHSSGAINSSDLREWACVPGGSMSNHMKKLERWELVKEIDRVYVGGGNKAIVWELTDRGQDFCENHLDDIRTIPSPTEVKHLRERVTKLETRIEEMEQQHEKDLDDLEQRVKKMVASIRDSL